MLDYNEKIDHHLNLAAEHEKAGDLPKAETEFKRAVFYDARNQGIDVKQHVAGCCPVHPVQD